VLNPAIAIAFDVTSLNDGVQWGFVYALAHIIAAVLAAAAFRVVRPNDRSYNEKFGGVWKVPLPALCASEFIGTFMLALTIGLAAVSGNTMGSWAAAATLMSFAYSLGNVSGALFNPALTLATLLSGRGVCPGKNAGIFIAVQFVAAILAGCLYAWFHAGSGTILSNAARSLEPKAGHNWWQCGVAELIFTAILSYVYLSYITAARPSSQVTRYNNMAGLVIGMCLAMCGFAIGNTSGGELNPAVCLAVAIENLVRFGWDSASKNFWPNFFIFAIWEFFGGVLGFAMFRATHPAEYSPREYYDAVNAA
jgi:glycerol uptake facilitator-like aquaporin